MTELFSSFTLTYVCQGHARFGFTLFTLKSQLRHREIEKMELEFLHKHISDPNLLSRLPKWFQSLANGDLPDGAADVFSTLVNKLVTGPTQTG